MRSSKHGLKALVLAIMAVLGTMAFGAAGAQGQLPGESKVGSITINGGAALLAPFVGSQNGTGSLLVPGRDLKLECQTGHIEEGKIDTATDALVKVTFLGCLSFKISDGKHRPCETVGLGTISATALILPILHGKITYVLAEPLSGTSFTTIEYKAGTECPLPPINPVTGSITAQVSELEGTSPTLTFSPTIQLLTGDVLRFGGFPAYIHGSADVELIDSHEGQKLGIH